MRIGILITSISNFGEKGFYNSQEIGLAKELSCLFSEVVIYKLINSKEYAKVEKIESYNNVEIRFIPAGNIGINGLINVNKLDISLDVLFYFADTQIAVPYVYSWTKKNNIIFIPYIGTTESKSKNILIKAIIDKLFQRNVSVYKKCNCLVKTPSVKNELNNYGVENVQVAPVGLDVSILNQNYDLYSSDDLRLKWGFSKIDNIILFVGRLVPEKNPLELIDIFNSLYKSNLNYSLLIVGDGPLRENLNSVIMSSPAKTRIKTINKIPNDRIWELYKISDYFVNLCSEEIFGMAILEAMFYKCLVVALRAPGPSYIIDDKITGFLCNNDNEVKNTIKNNANYEYIVDSAYDKLMIDFTWKNTAKIISTQVKKMYLHSAIK